MLVKTLSTALTLTAVLLGGTYYLAQPGGGGIGTVQASEQRALPGPRAAYSVGDQAELLQSVSGLGALARCAHEGWYKSEIYEDTMYRTLAIFRAQADNEASFVHYFQQMFEASAQASKYRVAVLSADRTKIIEAQTVDIKDASTCKAVEADLTRFRKPGGVLDVKPAPKAGQDA